LEKQQLLECYLWSYRYYLDGFFGTGNIIILIFFILIYYFLYYKKMAFF
jgi:hypothetical protein